LYKCGRKDIGYFTPSSSSADKATDQIADKADSADKATDQIRSQFQTSQVRRITDYLLRKIDTIEPILKSVKKGPGAQSATDSKRTRGPIPETKAAGALHELVTPPSSAEVKNTWSCYTITSCSLIVWFLIKHRDKFTF
jgi:hypothetical protein